MVSIEDTVSVSNFFVRFGIDTEEKPYAYATFILVISEQICICKCSDHVTRYRIGLLFLLLH